MAATVAYALVRKNFPLKSEVTGKQLYDLIGHPEKGANANWLNTCAIRVSLALVRSGVPVGPGYLTINGGPFKGKKIESRQRVLADYLRRRWGEPERFKGGDAARRGIGRRRGVISFYNLWGPTDRQGHIDLVGPDTWGEAACADDCYWSSVEIWFWPLK